MYVCYDAMYASLVEPSVRRANRIDLDMWKYKLNCYKRRIIIFIITATTVLLQLLIIIVLHSTPVRIYNNNVVAVGS